MLKKLPAVAKTVALMASAGSVVYLVGGKELRIAGQGVVRFTRTALTVSSLPKNTFPSMKWLIRLL